MCLNFFQVVRTIILGHCILRAQYVLKLPCFMQCIIYIKKITKICRWVGICSEVYHQFRESWFQAHSVGMRLICPHGKSHPGDSFGTLSHQHPGQF